MSHISPHNLIVSRFCALREEGEMTIILIDDDHATDACKWEDVTVFNG